MYLEQTETEVPIHYDWWLAGPDGASFLLYPIKGKHTKEDLLKAKRRLRSQRDVVSMKSKWVDADELDKQ